MNENDYCFECGKKFKNGEEVSGSPVDGYCCKGGCKIKMIPYHYVGYNNPVSERCTSGCFNYHEIIKELWKFPKQKENQMENVEITVKVNGIATPLHKISEQTLLTVRENSKPKEIPVARVVDFHNFNRRLLLRVPHNIGKFVGQIVAIDLKYGDICNNWAVGGKYPCGYKNIRVIS